MYLESYGFTLSLTANENKKSGIPARITAVHKERYALVCEQGMGYARLKTSSFYGGQEHFPTVGDFVLIDFNTQGDSIILHTLERKSYFSRLDPSSSGHSDQAVAANFDYIFIMQSLNMDFNIRRLERYLTLSWQSRALPVVILTKADLAQDYENQLRTVEEIAAGVEVFAVSAKTGHGLEALSAYLKPGRTIVFLGSSGVGKSSLANALAGVELMDTGEIREDDSRGRHTTTHRQLIMLPGGAMIIDTPGMRELGMWDVTQGLGQSFADVEQYFGRCKFSDCRHQSEPGCAVKEAIECGELSQDRWNSYCSLKNEAAYADDKEAYLRRKQARNKSIAVSNKNIQKHGKGGKNKW